MTWVWFPMLSLNTTLVWQKAQSFLFSHLAFFGGWLPLSLLFLATTPNKKGFQEIRQPKETANDSVLLIL